MSPTPTEILKSGAAELGIKLTDVQLGQFERFTELLIEWNAKFNLTRITDPFEITVKHYLDSISLFTVTGVPDGASLIDIGTGAGMPGIPLKIVVPDLKLTLLDSLKKRLSFVEAAVADLGMKDVSIIHARAEDAAREKAYREKYDFAVSRAVSRFNVLCEFCLPFCKVGGRFIAYKGPDAEPEVQEATRPLAMLGGQVEKVRRFALPHSELMRTLIVVKKSKSTPPAYPRKAGLPERSPL